VKRGREGGREGYRERWRLWAWSRAFYLYHKVAVANTEYLQHWHWSVRPVTLGGESATAGILRVRHKIGIRSPAKQLSGSAPTMKAGALRFVFTYLVTGGFTNNRGDEAIEEYMARTTNATMSAGRTRPCNFCWANMFLFKK